MYYAKSLRDIIKSTPLNYEFFEGLDEFHMNFLEMCFKQILEEQMGLMTEVEKFNLDAFHDFRHRQSGHVYLDQTWYKKSA